MSCVTLTIMNSVAGYWALNQTQISFNVFNASCQWMQAAAQLGPFCRKVGTTWKFEERCSSRERKLVQNWGKNFREHVSRLNQSFPDREWETLQLLHLPPHCSLYCSIPTAAYTVAYLLRRVLLQHILQLLHVPTNRCIYCMYQVPTAAYPYSIYCSISYCSFCILHTVGPLQSTTL